MGRPRFKPDTRTEKHRVRRRGETGGGGTAGTPKRNRRTTTSSENHENASNREETQGHTSDQDPAVHSSGPGER